MVTESVLTNSYYGQMAVSRTYAHISFGHILSCGGTSPIPNAGLGYPHGHKPFYLLFKTTNHSGRLPPIAIPLTMKV